MMNLGYGTTYAAVRAIGAAWKEALPEGQFEAVYDTGEPEFFQPVGGAPWASIRYSGPTDDGGGGLKNSSVPRFLSFAVRVYHTTDPYPNDGGDPYLGAQDLCLRGESDFEAMIASNPTLSGLVLDCVVLEGETGDMEDSQGNPFYGHELLVTVQVH